MLTANLTELIIPSSINKMSRLVELKPYHLYAIYYFLDNIEVFQLIHKRWNEFQPYQLYAIYYFLGNIDVSQLILQELNSVTQWLPQGD